MSLSSLVSKSYGRRSRDEHRQVAKAADLSFAKAHDAPMGFYLPTKDYMTQTKCVLDNGWIVEKPKEEEKKSLEDNKFHPRNFQDRHNANIKHAHGTTTLAFVFQGGILVAVDSRATMGSYIGSYTVKKVIPITKYIIGTMAGGAADCSYWERMLQLECRILELRNKDRMTVAAASKILANWCNAYKSYGLSIGAMMAGWDKRGPQLYYVDSDGMRLEAEYGFSVGSGSLYAYGVMDTEYRFDLSVEEAISLGRRAIYHATHRDAASGGYINVFHITEEGWTQISHDDCFDVHQAYYPERYAKPVPVEEKKDDEDGDVPMVQG